MADRTPPVSSAAQPVVLITGGATGIGRAVAEHFGARGSLVFVNYRSSEDAARAVVDTVTNLGGRAIAVCADVGTVEGAAILADAVGAEAVRLERLVHCATPSLSGPLLDVPDDALRECLEVNPLALIRLVRALLPVLAPGGSVCYVSSQGALSVIPDYGPLGISKALGEHIVRYLARELAPHGVRALTVAPGAVDSAAFRRAFGQRWPERLAAAQARSLAGRGVGLADIAKAIDALGGPDFPLTYGDRIRVDGGANL